MLDSLILLLANFVLLVSVAIIVFRSGWLENGYMSGSEKASSKELHCVGFTSI